MVTLHYIRNKQDKYIRPNDDLLYEDKNEIERWMKNLSDGFRTLWDNENYEIGSFQINDKCRCTNYMQTTMILLDFKDPTNIQFVGSDNFIGIYRKIGYTVDVDIESHTNGRYQLMSQEYFNTHFKITGLEERNGQ